MSAEQQVYQEHAEEYERLIAREDYQGNILQAVERICASKDLDVIDLGAGTGRLARLLAPSARSIKAYDVSAHMLETARTVLQGMGLANWQVGVADHRQVPEPDACADLVVSGWSFAYLAVWGGEQWREGLEAGYREVRRLLRPGGMFILLETLGTGQETPAKVAHLAEYYDWLAEKGFQSSWIRTDYRFQSLQEAAQLAAFFFGTEMEERVIANNWVTLPECTGVWWQKMPG